MSQAPDPDRIRPSVYVIALILSLGSGWAIWAATQHDTLADARAEAAEREDEASRPRPVSWRDDSRSHQRRQSRATGDYAHHDWGQESEAARLMSLDLPGPGFWRDVSFDGQAVRGDPQLYSMWRAFHGELGDADEPPLPFEPTAHHATLLDSEGDVIRDPSTCAVRVLPTRAGRFNCMVRVMCDDEVLYPDDAQQAGYVPCDVENGMPVRAVDDGYTSADGDPLVTFDMSSGTVTVADYDASGAVRYRATLRINQS